MRVDEGTRVASVALVAKAEDDVEAEPEAEE